MSFPTRLQHKILISLYIPRVIVDFVKFLIYLYIYILYNTRCLSRVDLYMRTIINNSYRIVVSFDVTLPHTFNILLPSVGRDQKLVIGCAQTWFYHDFRARSKTEGKRGIRANLFDRYNNIIYPVVRTDTNLETSVGRRYFFK